ncbi:GH32 C-terminal domain-containing protein [Paenibacillus oenotherae]|nr:GH32 C-terminal domain-containing protein [Paenibacillus oenotherae]
MDQRIAHWRFNEGTGHETADLVTGGKDSIQFALRKGRFQSPQDPDWKKGAAGSALSFDGYSTFIRKPADQVRQPEGQLTIAAWIAPRTFDFGMDNRLSAVVNQHHRELGQGYVFGLFRHGAWSLQVGLDDEWAQVWCLDPLPLHEWSFIAGVYDCQSASMKLYLNGEEVSAAAVERPSAIRPSTEDLLVGRNNQGVVLAESFIMNHFDGLMDELIVYDRALTREELVALKEQHIRDAGGGMPRIAPQDMEIPRRQFSNDRHRPQYHLSPPGHWMNEPHAPIFFDGRYHLFYQYNPSGPFWHYIHWGHWVSEDLAHWRDVSIALRPEPGLDPDGIWSGSACLDAEGIPVLFYTAGDLQQKPSQSVGLARSTYLEDGDRDLARWVKHPVPVIAQEPGVGLFGEFRDPFVWREEEVWYALVGTGTGDEGGGGTAMVYTSGNLIDWTFRGPLYTSDYAAYPYLGTAWELPVLLPIARRGQQAEKHIFIICPWGQGAKVEVNYWIGTWDRLTCRFVPDHEEPGLIDVGDFHFTGPSGMVDPESGRTLLFTIAQGERTPEIDYDCGWSHSAGMPLSLFLREDGGLGIEPVEEIALLRGNKLYEASGLSMKEVNAGLSGIRSDAMEIRITFNTVMAERYGLSLRRSPDGEEETILYYNRADGMLMVNREKSTLDARERTGGIQGGTLVLPGDEALELRVFVDRSLIEGYANERKSLTTRTYPSRTDALGIQLWADGPVEDVSIEIWEMTAAFDAERQC